jgi:hypothetical protein
LRMYRAEWVEKLQVQKTQPLHDFASHGADAFRYAVVGGLLVSDVGRESWKTKISRAGAAVP